MNYTEHPLNPEQDLPRVMAFMSAAAQSQPETGYLHRGDVLWQLYQNTLFDPQRHFRLWQDEAGEIIALAWHERPDGVTFQVRPDWRGRGHLEPPILAWGETMVDTTASAYDGHLWTRLCEADRATIALLTELGFQRDDWFGVNLYQVLHQPVTPPVLPPGFTVRAVGDENEWEQRVNLHRSVWHPSRVTLEAYQRLRRVPGYDPELDLVVVTPDGEMAAYCICWYDPVTQTGEFEPVGTDAKFRGRGLGKIVIQEGLRRLQALGAHTAYVFTTGSNQAARRLYETCGFVIYAQEHLYGRLIAQ